MKKKTIKRYLRSMREEMRRRLVSIDMTTLAHMESLKYTNVLLGMLKDDVDLMKAELVKLNEPEPSEESNDEQMG